MRGQTKVAADSNLLVAATNLARLTFLGLRQNLAGIWAEVVPVVVDFEVAVPRSRPA